MAHVNVCHDLYVFEKYVVIIMLGIDDPQIWIAYVLCIVSALGCMVYGLLKWNEEEQEDF